jgi:hypothetical protein
MGSQEVAQMILFPLMTAWMWFQMFEASSLPVFVPHRQGQRQR